jgi:CDP-glucose 4,6-dehydratase
VPVLVTRFGNIYGEGDLNMSRIIPGIMEAIILNKTLELRSDGTFVRDYLNVHDVVDGYILLAANIEKAIGHVYNFGSSDTLTVVGLIQEIEKVLKIKVPFTVQNTAKNEIPYQSLNYSKIKKQFGWQTQRSVQGSAKDIYKWYKLHFT